MDPQAGDAFGEESRMKQPAMERLPMDSRAGGEMPPLPDEPSLLAALPP